MLGRPAEAEPLVREVMEKYRRTLGEDHPNTLASINNMGGLLNAIGRPIEAVPFFREASEKCRRILGDEHPQTLNSINNLVNVLLTLDRPSEAEPLSREALAGYRRLFGSDHPQTLLLVNKMGHLLTMLGRLTEAETFYREALERYRRILGNDQPQTLNSINYMGHLLTLLGRLTEAETFYREALTGFQNRNDKANIDLVRVSLAELLNKANRPNEAMELLESMMESGDISVIKNLFEAYRLLEQRERTLEAAPKWLEIQRSQSPAKPLTTMNCLRVVARALNRISAFERAEPMAREAIELATKIDLKGRELARVQLTLGRSLVGLGRIEEARPLIESGHETIMREAESIRYEIRQEVIDDAQEALNQLKEAAQKSPAD
jgi:tetratricopeptide (TPR) repeat protein